MGNRQRLSRGTLLASTLALLAGQTGCVVLAAPLIVDSMSGSKASTATVVIEEPPAKVYAEAIATIQARGYSKIEKQDDAKYFIEATRDGKNATFQATPQGDDETRVLLTIENDEDGEGLNQALEGLMEVCRRLGAECQR